MVVVTAALAAMTMWCSYFAKKPTAECDAFFKRKCDMIGEQVMQMVQERAPGGFNRIEDVLSAEELEAAAAGYKRLAGFDVGELNERASIVQDLGWLNAL